MTKIPYKHINVLVMPTDYCNMNCVYCFNGRRTFDRNKVMSEEILERIFKTIIPFYNEIHFIWHGGEPLSMGLEFYRKAVDLQNRINTGNAVITNGIQSNLTLLDDEFARFLIEHKFHFGSSFDGTTNECTRHNSERIMNGKDILMKNGSKAGFICVIQKNNVNNLLEDYEWFKERGISYTLNPYLSSPPYEEDPLYITPDEFIKNASELFDHWLYDCDTNINIGYFTNILNYLLQKKKTMCCYSSCIGRFIGIHYDGRIYNCNRDFDERYCYGNVLDYKDIHECFESEGFKNMLEDAISRRNECREQCPIYDFCSGGCNSYAVAGGSMRKANEHSCAILKGMYKHIAEKVAEMLCMEDDCIDGRVNRFVLKILKDRNQINN